MKSILQIIFWFIILSIITGIEISSTFFVGFFFGCSITFMNSRKFNKKIFFDIVVKGTCLGLILVHFLIASGINSITFAIAFGIIIGYPYFCKPSKWYYDGLRYHKYC